MPKKKYAIIKMHSNFSQKINHSGKSGKMFELNHLEQLVTIAKYGTLSAAPCRSLRKNWAFLFLSIKKIRSS